jgi:glycosyltransferase involved in cell wall biosynthesis
MTASNGARRAAVYNRFWHSQGGGERHAGMIAEVLSGASGMPVDPQFPDAPPVAVDLVGHGPVNLEELGDHLGLDLSRCAYRDVPDTGELDLAEITEDYDLWITASYMSRLAPRAKRSGYLCFFPTPFDHDFEPWRRFVMQKTARYFQLGGGAIGYGLGWYPPEGGRRRRWTWTTEDAVLSVPAGPNRLLQMDLGRPGAPGPVQLRLEDGDGKLIRELQVGNAFTPFKISLGPSEHGTELHFRADTFNPGTTDRRTLGVAVSKLRMTGLTHGGGVHRRLRVYLAIRFPWLRNDPLDFNFLGSYGTVFANSEYTRGYIKEWWHRDADVLFPPIATDRLHPTATREKLILTVGRFFSPGLGHAKRQLEMVQWFGEMHRAGLLDGWRLAVVGGCEKSQLPYLDQVKQAAAGLPVEIHANAPRPLVERLLTTASIFWSATGFGEGEKRPWAAEHFGMTTVEAMAGGCVPVVIDKAGQKEIITPGVDGFRWQSPEQLKEQTARVAGNEELRARLSSAAVARSAEFSDEAFAERWQRIASASHLLD